MKRWLYCKNTEGGLEYQIVVAPQDLIHLYGWMTPSCRTDDMALLNWMRTAVVGDYTHHRLGIMVRLQNIT